MVRAGVPALRLRPGVDRPDRKAFLARNFGDDPQKARLFQQWAGYLLLPDVSYQRFLMMVGEGANGKSKRLRGRATALLGEDNVSSVPLEMFGDKFRLAGTLGKLANVKSPRSASWTAWPRARSNRS